MKTFFTFSPTMFTFYWKCNILMKILMRFRYFLCCRIHLALITFIHFGYKMAATFSRRCFVDGGDKNIKQKSFYI